jgi:hypothetical protein
MKMRRVLLGAFLLIAIVASALPASAAPGSPQAPSLDRILFVHYRVHPPEAKGHKPPGGDKADVYKWAPKLRWASSAPSIIYRVDSANSSDLSPAAIGSAVAAAFDTWTLADDNVTFLAGAPVSLTNDPFDAPDGINSISWRSLGPGSGNIIALTAAWYNAATKIVSEADTVCNDDLSWSVTPYAAGDPDPTYAGPVDGNGDPTSFDVTDIATHEFGHWLVLGDLYRPGTSLLTMYGYSSEGETYKDTLAAGDILGIQAIYR